MSQEILDSNPLVSVVTPFYNTEKYLSECIESVLKQSYQRFEYILVNNCSTDRSREIAQHYSTIDPRIRVIDNEVFLTQVQNYNHALRQISAESKYCKIVQADDWLFPECLTKMVQVGEGNPSVGIIGAYRLDDVRVNCDGLPYSSTVISGREICRLQLLEGLFVFGSATTLLIRSDIVRKRGSFYNEESLYEDTEACYEILQNCDFGFVHQVLTFTRRENDSIRSSIMPFNPVISSNFIMLKKYGPIFLSEEEYARCLKSIEDRYLSFLARSLFECRGKKFWTYHRDGFKAVGYQLGWAKLSTFVVWELIDIVFNLKKTTGRLLSVFKRGQQFD